jgi:hypothetical protein
MTIRNEELAADPIPVFSAIFSFLHLLDEPAPAQFVRGHRVNSSFHERLIAPAGEEGRPDPWEVWSIEQKRIFLEEAGEMMVRCGYLSPAELAGLEAEVAGPDEVARPRWSRQDHARAYAHTKGQVRAVVGEQVPTGAIVLVVSKGDEELLELGGAIGWHFPQLPDGTYAGSYPETGQEVVRQLQGLQRRGAGYLVLPEPAFWWPEHYREVGAYLGESARLVHEDDQVRLYRLEGGG